MKIFVTGASGFIGGTVADLLRRKGHDVHGLVRGEDKAEQLKANAADALVNQTLDQQ